MSGGRPHFQDSIALLEQLVEQHRLDRQRLEIIAAELHHRDTDRAHRLRAKITSILDGLELQLSLQPVAPSALPEHRRWALTIRRPAILAATDLMRSEPSWKSSQSRNLKIAPR